LGNRPDARALPALTAGLEDADPAVREACRWALERYDRGELKELNAPR
jgi:HEAT repeat protein